jgi:hypothetical protein
MCGRLRALSTASHGATRIMRPALASRPPPPPAHAAGEVEVLIPHAYGLRRIATRCGCITRVRLGLLCVGKRVSTHLRAQIHRATPSRRRSRYVFVRLPGVGTDVRMVVHVVPLLRGVVVYLQRIYFSRQLLLGGRLDATVGERGRYASWWAWCCACARRLFFHVWQGVPGVAASAAVVLDVVAPAAA